jgi:hypothetical protein
MSGLLDLAPQRARVKLASLDEDGNVVANHEIEVGGLTMGHIAELLRRFPAVREAFSAAANMDADGLFTLLRDAIPPIIAAGVGHLGEEPYEERAAALSAEAQLMLFGAILKITMPDGAGPFAERVSGALGHLLRTPPNGAA